MPSDVVEVMGSSVSLAVRGTIWTAGIVVFSVPEEPGMSQHRCEAQAPGVASFPVPGWVLLETAAIELGESPERLEGNEIKASQLQAFLTSGSRVNESNFAARIVFGDHVVFLSWKNWQVRQPRKKADVPTNQSTI